MARAPRLSPLAPEGDRGGPGRGVRHLEDDLGTIGSTINQRSLESLDSSLDTLQNSVVSLEDDWSSVRTPVGDRTDQRLPISERTITMANRTYTTFPGYSPERFPCLGTPTSR